MHLRADLSRCIASKSGAINYLIILRAKAAHCQGAAACSSSNLRDSLDILQGSLFYIYNMCSALTRRQHNLFSTAAGRSLAARTFALRTAAVQLCAFNVIISAITLTCRCWGVKTASRFALHVSNRRCELRIGFQFFY